MGLTSRKIDPSSYFGFKAKSPDITSRIYVDWKDPHNSLAFFVTESTVKSFFNLPCKQITRIFPVPEKSHGILLPWLQPVTIGAVTQHPVIESPFCYIYILCWYYEFRIRCKTIPVSTGYPHGVDPMLELNGAVSGIRY